MLLFKSFFLTGTYFPPLPPSDSNLYTLCLANYSLLIKTRLHVVTTYINTNYYFCIIHICNLLLDKKYNEEEAEPVATFQCLSLIYKCFFSIYF